MEEGTESSRWVLDTAMKYCSLYYCRVLRSTRADAIAEVTVLYNPAASL